MSEIKFNQKNMDLAYMLSMGEIKLNQKDLELAYMLSMTNSDVDKYTILLKNDFGYTLTKSELAKLIETSTQTIDRRIKSSSNIPNYRRLGEGSKSPYIFPIIDVAKFLADTIKTA